MHVQLNLLSTVIMTSFTLRTVKGLQIQHRRYVLHILQGESGFHFFMDLLKSDKVAVLSISQGSIDFWYTKFRFWAQLCRIIITKILSKTSDRSSCLTLNISIANCRILFSCFVQESLHKKWSFTLRISSLNMTKSAGNCGSGHIYWRNP